MQFGLCMNLLLGCGSGETFLMEDIVKIRSYLHNTTKRNKWLNEHPGHKLTNVVEILSDKNKKQLYIPEGFAHGFLTLSDTSEFLYKTTDYYAPEHERCIAWNDPDLAIVWPLQAPPVLASKDANAPILAQAEVFV